MVLLKKSRDYLLTYGHQLVWLAAGWQAGSGSGRTGEMYYLRPVTDPKVFIYRSRGGRLHLFVSSPCFFSLVSRTEDKMAA